MSKNPREVFTCHIFFQISFIISRWMISENVCGSRWISFTKTGAQRTHRFYSRKIYIPPWSLSLFHARSEKELSGYYYPVLTQTYAGSPRRLTQLSGHTNRSRMREEFWMAMGKLWCLSDHIKEGPSDSYAVLLDSGSRKMHGADLSLISWWALIPSHGSRDPLHLTVRRLLFCARLLLVSFL